MSSRAGRLAVLAGAAVAVVVLFVALSGGDEDDGSPERAATQVETTERSGNEENRPDKPKPKPDIPVIEVKGGQPVGGVEELEYDAGGSIEFVVRSDAPQQVHLHGYDIYRDVTAGGSARFDVPADVEGVFEVELEGPHTPIAQITVSP